ncbi:MAG: RagB/SusD family nutrient uptake outer membrane protein [Bacteroidaceae bacterium]|nr:RagB/SusD family nutrient uptake outer membrane protein [Bacteroidaceae bacterium]
MNIKNILSHITHPIEHMSPLTARKRLPLGRTHGGRTLLCALLIGLSSCNSFLDITPDGQAKRDEMLQTKSGIEDALYGVYAQLRQSNLYGCELSIRGVEVLAQNMTCPGNDGIEMLQAYDYEKTDIRSWAESIWTLMYNNISNTNSVLQTDLVKDATAFPFTTYKGEALALRAFMHFDLVRLFTPQYTLNQQASGIPYQTEFSLKTPDFESLQKNYEHILTDLLEAEQLLKVEPVHQYEMTAFMNDRQTHLNLYAVWGTLARVYLTMGNKEKALAYADSVITKSPYCLKEKTEVINDVAGVLSQKETLFGVYFGDFYSTTSELLQKRTFYQSLDPRDDFMDYYERESLPLDYRTSAYFTQIEAGGQYFYRLSKFTDIYELNGIAGSRPAEQILGINLMRIPEMYYIAAECLLESDPARAKTYYNKVREHRGLNTLGASDQLTQELINLEFFKEYFGEGQQFYNYKRQNLPIVSFDGKKTFSASDKIYVIPIPNSEYANRY